MTTQALPLEHSMRATKLAAVKLDDPLPAGVVGRVGGVAVVYDVVDEFGTVFQPGCFARTMRERVAAGKVRLFLDHGDAHLTGAYSTRLHIGTVRSLTDASHEGQAVAFMVADLFDTPAGRDAHNYLLAVGATEGETGLSVGWDPNRVKSVRAQVGGAMRTVFTELALREISVTVMSAVPGTAVTAVRAASAALDYLPILRGVEAALGPDAFRALYEREFGHDSAPPDSDAAEFADSDAAPEDSHRDGTDAAPAFVPYDVRLMFVRSVVT